MSLPVGVMDAAMNGGGHAGIGCRLCFFFFFKKGEIRNDRESETCTAVHVQLSCVRVAVFCVQVPVPCCLWYRCLWYRCLWYRCPCGERAHGQQTFLQLWGLCYIVPPQLYVGHTFLLRLIFNTRDLKKTVKWCPL